jgi:hypothetical protein
VISDEETQEDWEAVTFSTRQVVDNMNDVLVDVSTSLVMICEVDNDVLVEVLNTVVGVQAISDYWSGTTDTPLLERRNGDIEANNSIANGQVRSGLVWSGWDAVDSKIQMGYPLHGSRGSRFMIQLQLVFICLE